MQFRGREEVTEFDAQHFAAEGIFSQNSSEGHKDGHRSNRGCELVRSSKTDSARDICAVKASQKRRSLKRWGDPNASWQSGGRDLARFSCSKALCQRCQRAKRENSPLRHGHS